MEDGRTAPARGFTPAERVRFRLLTLVYALVFMGSVVLLSLYGERIGLTRDVGLWVWAAAMTALAVLFYGPFIQRRTSVRRALLALALVLLAGAGTYAFVALFMVPPALEAANEAGGKPPSDDGVPGRRWAR